MWVWYSHIKIVIPRYFSEKPYKLSCRMFSDLIEKTCSVDWGLVPEDTNWVLDLLKEVVWWLEVKLFLEGISCRLPCEICLVSHRMV